MEQTEQQGLGGRPEEGVNASATAAEPRDETAAEKNLKDRVWGMRFRLGASRRYSSRLAAHYSGLDNLTTVIGLIGGSAVFAQALSVPGALSLYASLAVVIATAARLAFLWPDKARLFTDLYRRYTRLQETLVRSGDLPAEAELRKIEAKFTLIEAAEPAIRNALMIVCHSEEVTSMGGDPSTKHPLRWWQRWFATYVTLPPFSWE